MAVKQLRKFPGFVTFHNNIILKTLYLQQLKGMQCYVKGLEGTQKVSLLCQKWGTNE